MIALGKYLSWADAMRAHTEKIMPQARGKQLGDVNVSLALMYIGFWFSALCTCIEGYNEIGIADPDINKLLQNQKTKDILRKYRNVTYHFQRELFDDREVDFIHNAHEVVPWVAQLRLALWKFVGNWNDTHKYDGSPR
jgi:hypothetical protein